MLKKVKEFLISTGNNLVEAINCREGPLSTEVILKLLDYKKVGLVEKSLEGLSFFLQVPSHILIPNPLCGGFRLIIPVEDIKSVPFNEKKIIRPTQMFLGIDDRGADLIICLSEITHTLIAGATGSGKSMCIHTIIHSLLAKQGTSIIYLDPKRVEGQLYSGLGSDTMQIASAPRDILSELTIAHSWMEDRYQYMANHHIREAMPQWLKNYDENLKPMVLICDEVGDMLSEIPTARNILLSLSSKSRAAGLRIFLATQRPDVKIIDGAIKANFTTRICFKTSSRVDSSIILGFGGGEHLRGKGHGILLSGDNNITTFKGAVIEGIRLNKYSTTDVYCPAAAASVVLKSTEEDFNQLKKLK